MRNREILMLFPAGCETIVENAVGRDLAGVHGVDISSGCLRCRVSAAVKTLASLPYATNVFDVVAEVPASDLDSELEALSKIMGRTQRPSGLPKRGEFRLRIFDMGRFATTGIPDAARLITVLASWSGLRHGGRGGHIEFWVVRRRGSPWTVLGVKLPKRRLHRPRGSLRPEIAAALARIVPIGAADTVLDPFAGSAAIGVAALDAGARRVWLNDIAGDSMELMRGLSAVDRRRIHRTHMDFRLLGKRDGPSISAVITDPPWGLFEDTAEPIDLLYTELAVCIACPSPRCLTLECP